jgi:parallel beta-helix repeat protein
MGKNNIFSQIRIPEENMKRKFLFFSMMTTLLIASCGQAASSSTSPLPEVTSPPPTSLTHTGEPLVSNEWAYTSIQWVQGEVENKLFLDSGGDVDTEVASVGNPPVDARRTGNGQALTSPDGNQVEDYYMQFRIDDSVIFAGSPTTLVRVEVEYFDQGTDSFFIQYDALAGGPFGDGTFKETDPVIKTDSQSFQTAVFTLNDAYFANRDNGADFRISDLNDGAEIIRSVTVTLLPETSVVNVDSCGADPWDSNPDSDAIQDCVDKARDGDTITFTSGIDSPGYQGYLIDKTIFLVATSAKSDLTFTSTDATNHALLQATGDLKGFVVRLFARSQISKPGGIDNIKVVHLNLDGSQDIRLCYGEDEIENGLDDNWGSWLPECSQSGDPWCRAGTLAMDAEMDWGDATQDYRRYPSKWTTGLIVENVISLNTECGSGISMVGSAASTIRDSTVETAGDHVHVTGCAPMDKDEPLGAWSDGITFAGPDNLITGNIIIDASDVGIVFFGGKDTIISNNTIQAQTGNHGMFAGIGIHPGIFGNVSNLQIIGNEVINAGDSSCGGIHAGINIGPHMWGAGCIDRGNSSGTGNPNLCSAEPPQPLGTLCIEDALCQEWAYVAEGTTITLKDNYVSGAQVNYLVEGLDLVGTLIESGNTSGPPRMTDWAVAKVGCGIGDVTDTWGAIDRVAHHPSLDGWVDQRIHCER